MSSEQHNKDGRKLTLHRFLGRCLWTDHHTASEWCSLCSCTTAIFSLSHIGSSCEQSRWLTAFDTNIHIIYSYNTHSTTNSLEKNNYCNTSKRNPLLLSVQTAFIPRLEKMNCSHYTVIVLQFSIIFCYLRITCIFGQYYGNIIWNVDIGYIYVQSFIQKSRIHLHNTQNTQISGIQYEDRNCQNYTIIIGWKSTTVLRTYQNITAACREQALLTILK